MLEIFRGFWNLISAWNLDFAESPCVVGTVLGIGNQQIMASDKSPTAEAALADKPEASERVRSKADLTTAKFRGLERRRSTRHACTAQAQFRSAGSNAIGSGQVKNLSLGGCHIRISGSFSPGAVLEIVLCANGARIYLTGRVTTIHSSDGVGVEFTPGSTVHGSQFTRFAKLAR